MTNARLKYLEELVENMSEPHGGIDDDEENWKKVYPSDVKELIKEIRRLEHENSIR